MAVSQEVQKVDFGDDPFWLQNEAIFWSIFGSILVPKRGHFLTTFIHQMSKSRIRTPSSNIYRGSHPEAIPGRGLFWDPPRPNIGILWHIGVVRCGEV